ncbi:unnamed protein product [Brassica oleracea]|uniref:(rape) hypothetical protein n=1 Tax=Brassica napus TaxID=3708 RepID=A0A816MGK8_BRANA|nr:unnamed protein product [Brassica napus]
MVDASRLLGHQTYQHMNKREEKKKVTQVMSKRDGEEMKLVRDGVKRQRRRLLSRLMLTALATNSEVTKPRFMKSESCEEDHRRQMSKPETIET